MDIYTQQAVETLVAARRRLRAVETVAESAQQELVDAEHAFRDAIVALQDAVTEEVYGGADGRS